MGEDANAEQAGFWNGDVGRRWLRHGEALEALTEDVSALLLARAALGPGMRVLEVGCGAGGLALAMGQAVGAEGVVLGLDISEPLLAEAEARRKRAGLGQVAFRTGDAQVMRLPGAGFDLVASQFGAMFFADPLAAFRNLGSALRPSGRMLLVAWGAVGANPFFARGRETAVRRLGPPAETGPVDGPGPFAFADRGRVERMLAEAGFGDGASEAVPVTLRPPGGPEGTARLATELGPAAARMREAGASEEDKAAIQAELAAAYAEFATPEGMRVPGLVNLFEARA